MMKGNHSSTRIYNQTDIAPHSRSLFDLSHRKLLTTDFGRLVPTLCEECIPGDFFKIANQLLVRFNPMVAPIMHEVNVFIHYFFVPYRLLWPKPDYTETGIEEGSWEEFITGGVDGNNDDVIPVWNPDAAYSGPLKSLWDYFGFPPLVSLGAASQPAAFPKRAYNLVYNEYYRDETLCPEVDLDQNDVLFRCWEKDYFTSALLWQQRGTAPALPVTVTGSAIWADNAFGSTAHSSALNPFEFANTTPGTIPQYQAQVGNSTASNFAKQFMNSNSLDAEAVTFDVSDLRLVFQIQKFLERNARNGARYTESLKAHFGVSPRDDRLQRPEYIGGIKNPVIVSEVLQTSSIEEQPTPQGNMAGHGITVDASFAGTYRVQEFGLIIGIMSVMPRSMYQQGIDRCWLRKTRYDFPFPEFMNLSEQAIENIELYASGNPATDLAPFGYQGRFDELRQRRSIVTSDFRYMFDYWHLGRRFGSTPVLNQQFVQMSATENIQLKRVFADQVDDAILCSVGNIVTANRPMPIIPVPGYIDH